MRNLVAVFLVAILISPLQAQGFDQSRLVNELTEGMTYAEVLKSWGAPLAKIEKEAKRVDVWMYDDSTINFYEGKLVSIEQRENASGETRVARADTTSSSTQIEPDVAVNEILNEIMDEASE